MSRKKQRFDYHEHDDLNPNVLDAVNIASSNESTGLIPTVTHSQAESKSYQDITNVWLPKRVSKENKRKKKKVQDQDLTNQIHQPKL